ELDFSGGSIRYEYDKSFEYVAIINQAGERTTFSRDVLGRVVEKVCSDGTRVSFEYDLLGNIATAVNADARVTFVRDATGRVVTEVQGADSIVSQYDQVGNRIRRETSFGHRADFVYDAECQMVGLILNDESRYSFDRDSIGREAVRRLPSGFIIAQEFDSRGRLTSQISGPAVDSVARAWTRRTNGLASIREATIQRRYTYDQHGILQ